ncbi:MAG: aa3-type cytochrome c oxidase subunit IV [Alphaproteobacteria bacterium]|nr:aa3-type cytochrome c oxidase subunit IV [Alphaproteobacteria bacterium]
MAGNVDAHELARHQSDFRGFMHFICWLIGIVIVVLSGMAIFLL